MSAVCPATQSEPRDNDGQTEWRVDGSSLFPADPNSLVLLATDAMGFNFFHLCSVSLSSMGALGMKGMKCERMMVSYKKKIVVFEMYRVDGVIDAIRKLICFTVFLSIFRVIQNYKPTEQEMIMKNERNIFYSANMSIFALFRSTNALKHCVSNVYWVACRQALESIFLELYNC